MRSKPCRLALSGMVFVCAAFLVACNDSPRLQFVTVAPISGEIYVSAKPAGGVRGAARGSVRPALEGTGDTGKRPALTLQPVTATCGSLQYAATGLSSNGSTQDLTSTATWTSSNTSVATVSSSGLASGIGLGTTNIGASFKGVSAKSEPLAVDQLNSIKVLPATATVAAQGATQSFVADGNFTFASGGTSDLDVSSQVTWASSKPAVATIDNTGNATAVGPGTTTITATSCDGIMVGTATLTVGTPPTTTLVITPATITISTGTTTLFTAMEKLSNGTIQPIPPGTVVTWSSGTTAVATIDPTSAVALGITAGTSTITATETVSGFTGTATLTVQAAAARFAYVGNGSGNGGSGSISGYSVDVTGGTLTPLTGSPFPASGPQQVLIHPSGDFMYYIDVNGSLHVEDITPTTGALKDSLQTPVPATAVLSANVGVIDPTGRFIYVISDVGNSIYGFSIKQTVATDTAHNGALTSIQIISAPADPTLNAPTWIMTDRAGKYVYVVNSGASTISEYKIDQTTGALTLLGTPSIGTGNSPIYGTTDVNGHIYVANDGTTQSVSVYSIDPSSGSTAGELAKVGSDFPVTGATFTINVLTDPTGKYLYVLDSASSTAGQVFAYTLNTSSGAIVSQIGTTGQPTGGNSTGMAIDPTGVFMAIGNNATANLSLFQVSTSTGAPTPATPATVNADTAPQFVVFYTAASGQ
jgi:6-phosphogluconolactonase (cycloisomerase 2 family)